MWDSVKNTFYQNLNMYQKWKNRNNSTQTVIETSQDINHSNDVNQFIKNSLDLVKSDSKSGIVLGVVISYTLVWFANWFLAKPFYTGSIVALLFLLRTVLVDYIWPEICLPGTEHAYSSFTKTGLYLTSELNSKLKDIFPIVSESFKCMAELRDCNKELFCVLSTVFFLTTASIGSILPGFYWALILLTATWLTKIAFHSFSLQPKGMWNSTDLEDLVPELTDDTILVLEKARTSAVKLRDGFMPPCPADLTFGLTFSQSHFESLQLESSRNVLEEASDFEEDFEVIGDELSD